MIKVIKNILFCFFIFCSFFFYIEKVSANSISKIDIDVYLDSNGNAAITEVWNAYLSEGTEGYRPYTTELDNFSISNFSVSDDSGRTYDSLSSWDVNASFDSKAYKSGIHEILNGVELCWGISSYGNRTYTLKYNIDNFVTQYTDTQGIYFNFLNLDQPVENVKIIIHSEKPFSLDNAKIWAFGYEGTDKFENGNIVLDSVGSLSSDQYMVALVRFESNLFNTTNKSDHSFDDIYDSAFRNLDDSKNKEEFSFKEIITIIACIPFLIIVNPMTWIIVLWLLSKIKGNDWVWGSRKQSGSLNFGKEGNILPNENQIDYYRDIPCNKDLVKAYWVCLKYKVVSLDILKQGIIGAILLKWIQKGYITVTKTQKGLFDFKDNNYAIDFTKMTQADNEIENSLFKMLLEASDSNKILEAKEFLKWSKKNYSEVNSWFYSIQSKEQEYLEQEDLITSSTEETQAMFGRTRTITVKNVDPKLKEDAIQMVGLKKFLLDFSIMPEREYFEVHIWEEYLIFAQLLGIADKVEEQFSKLYPNFNQQTQLNTEITTIAIRSMAEICYKGVQVGVERAERASSSSGRDYSGRSRDSGSGGSSYSSGGSSAGGSSGGGFR